jgi:secondary thiamine-phosphate synthase enzyme
MRRSGGYLMRQASGSLWVRSTGRGLVDITDEVRGWLDSHSIVTGLVTLFCAHTSASLLIQENASAEVRADIEAFFERLVPEDPGLYDHDDEGPDDMPAHLRSALTPVHLSIPIVNGRLGLGTWQAIYLFEHRRRPHERRIALHLLGE